ncbi:MAG TPA: glycosyltransferase family 4 protein, partial [Stellaceae bacterium]|nr:glycosyltransferase family 4 protein [Stellaceae bacterium]
VIVATGWQTVYEILRINIRAKSFVYFVQCNEVLFNPQGSWDANLASLSYRLPFHYVTISQWLLRWLRDEYSQVATYIPNRYNPDYVHETQPLEPRRVNHLRILLEGPLSNPWKRMDDAFLAVQGIDAEIWCLSSGGELKPWQRPDRFFSRVPYSRVKEIMSSCDVLVKLSEIEGFFGPPLEMMACGGTAVVSRVAGYDEYIEDGKNALTVEIGDYVGARDKLRRLAGDPKLLASLKAGGAVTARAFAGWAPRVADMEVAFATFAASNASGPQRLILPRELVEMTQLGLDVRFSRSSDDPVANRRNWMTSEQLHPVQIEEFDEDPLINPAVAFSEPMRSYLVKIDIQPREWPERFGDNYAALLGIFCSVLPRNIILVSPTGDRSLRYPPVRLEKVNDPTRPYYLTVDTIVVYFGMPQYEFFLYLNSDVDIRGSILEPGLIRGL